MSLILKRKKSEIDVSEIVTGQKNEDKNDLLDVYDVVLGGVISE